MDKQCFYAYKNAPDSKYFTYTGERFDNAPRVRLVRISKTQLKRHLESGPVKVIMVGCNVNNYHILNGWHLGFELEITSANLEERINNWAYYNACHETGYYPVFFVEDTAPVI